MGGKHRQKEQGETSKKKKRKKKGKKKYRKTREQIISSVVLNSEITIPIDWTLNSNN